MNLQNKNTLFNLLSPIILNGINFFSIPIYTRILGPDQYGIVSVYSTWVSIFSILFGLQVQGSIGSAFSHISSKNKYEYLSSILLLGLFSSIISFFASLIFIKPISNTLLLNINVVICCFIQSIATFIINFSLLSFTFLKKAEKSLLISSITSISTTVLSLVFLYFVYSGENRFLGRIYGQIWPMILISTALALYFLIRGKFSFKKNYIIFCLPICIPLILHALSHIVLAQSDKLMIQHMLNNKEAGIYGFVVTFTSVLTVIWGALNNSWVPFYYDDLKSGNFTLLLSKTRGYLLNYSIISIVFVLWAPEVVKIFAPPSFWSCTSLLPFLVLSSYFIFLYSFPVNFEFYNRKTLSIAIGTIGAAVINISLNYLFIQFLGILGAAIATLIAHVFLFLFHDAIARFASSKKYHYNFLVFLPFILSTVAFVVLADLLKEFILTRWILGSFLSIFFFYHIWKKKSFF